MLPVRPALPRALRVAALSVLLLVAAGTAVAGTPKLSVPEAQQLMFPQATAFRPVPVATVARWTKAIANDPALVMLGARFQVWQVDDASGAAGWFVTDEVVGKFEKVDYAVALAPDASVLRVEVLRYRESHGQEIMARRWLAQFEGKTATSALKVPRDIDGISGATLSCHHITEGVRRVTRLVAAAQVSGQQ